MLGEVACLGAGAGAYSQSLCGGPTAAAELSSRIFAVKQQCTRCAVISRVSACSKLISSPRCAPFEGVERGRVEKESNVIINFSSTSIIQSFS